jgi:hypothetical protein
MSSRVLGTRRRVAPVTSVRLCLLVPLLLLVAGGDAAAQEIRGRVVEEANRRGIAGAEVTLVDAAGGQIAQFVTADDGFFTLHTPRPGSYRIVVVHPGFTGDERVVRIAGAPVRLDAFVLTAQAVTLDPIAAEGRRARTGAGTSAFSRPSYVMAGARLARLEQVHASALAAMREFSGLRVREIPTRTGRPQLCIESTRQMPSLGDAQRGVWSCNWVTIVLNGFTLMDPENTFRTLNLHEFESIEYLPPGGAGYQYGLAAGASGAIVLWSRGFGPHVNAERNARR